MSEESPDYRTLQRERDRERKEKLMRTSLWFKHLATVPAVEKPSAVKSHEVEGAGERSSASVRQPEHSSASNLKSSMARKRMREEKNNNMKMLAFRFCQKD